MTKFGICPESELLVTFSGWCSVAWVKGCT